MQKLSTSHNAGSTLVAALVLALIMSITALGFIEVSTSGVNNEVDALKNEQAFQSAESGLLMGARWLRGTGANFPQSGTVTPFTSALNVNNMDVYVTLTATTVAGNTTVKIVSEAYQDPSGNHAKTAATFKKRILLSQASKSTFGQYGTLLDAVSGGWGGFYNRIFNGRFHMNRYVIISDQSHPNSSTPVIFRNGLVTIATNPNYTGNYGTGAHDGNNYNNGVELGWSGTSAQDKADLDQIFTDRYLANQDVVALPTGLSAGAFSSGSHITLPTSLDNGESATNYRPSLEFAVNAGVPTAIYHYKNSSGTKLTQTFTNYSGSVFICNQNLNVFGTVQGAVTVATALGMSIFPVANLTYSDYNSTTGTIPSNSQNILGLVSGSDIRFNSQWDKDLEGQSAQQVTITGTLNLNGSLIAVESPNGTMGTEYWDQSTICNYGLNLTGNQILKAWDPPSTLNGNTVTGGAKGTITFTQDMRMVNAGIEPPAFPPVSTSSGLWVLDLEGWSEQNVY